MPPSRLSLAKPSRTKAKAYGSSESAGGDSQGSSQTARATLSLRELLLEGKFLPGERIREVPLAEELGVSRATVVAAVDELIAEGYAEGRHGSGVYVAPDLPDHVLRAAEQAAPLAESVLPRPDEVRPFQPAAPELALFPHEIWAKLMLKTWRKTSDGPTAKVRSLTAYNPISAFASSITLLPLSSFRFAK